jgi:hypothetical protein
MCKFLIVDYFGDGLFCFGDGVCGFYAIGVDGSVVVPGTLPSISSASETFVAQQPAPPTLAPTMTSSFVPSALPAPTVTAAPSGDAIPVYILVVSMAIQRKLACC